MNRDCDYEAVLEDYYSHIYGKDWKDVLNLLEAVEKLFDFDYMEGEKSADPAIGPFYDPARAPSFDRVFELSARARALSLAHTVMPTRPQTVSWALLEYYAEYLERWAAVMKEKALGNDYRALELIEEFKNEFGRHEIYIERYYDHGLLGHILGHVKKINKKQGIVW